MATAAAAADRVAFVDVLSRKGYAVPNTYVSLMISVYLCVTAASAQGLLQIDGLVVTTQLIPALSCSGEEA